MSDDNNARYITIADAAAYLGCSQKFIRRSIDSGALPAYRLGGGRAIRVDQQDLGILMVPVSDTEAQNAIRQAAERNAERATFTEAQVRDVAALIRGGASR